MGDLVQARLVPLLKRGVQPQVHQLSCCSWLKQPAPQAQNVGVVVHGGQLGRLSIMDEGRADPRDLVRRDGHSDTGAADEHAENGVAFAHSSAYHHRLVGVIAALSISRTHLIHVKSPATKMRSQIISHGHCGVVAADEDPFASFSHA